MGAVFITWLPFLASEYIPVSQTVPNGGPLFFSSLSQISIQSCSVVVMGLSETLGSDLRLLPATSKELYTQVNRKLLVCY